MSRELQQQQQEESKQAKQTRPQTTDTSSMDQGENPSGPPLCAAGCGFFGNPTCEDFCSKCYRDLKKSAPQAAQPAAPSPVRSIAAAAAAAASSVAAAASAAVAALPAQVTPASAAAPEGEEGAGDSPKKSKAPRCFTCRAKVGLLGFRCRCEQEFCPKHRHADEHSCPFDYKSFDRDNLTKANPVVQAQKINKI